MALAEIRSNRKNYIDQKNYNSSDDRRSYTLAEKTKLIVVLVLFGALVCGMIMLTAYSSDIKYTINGMNKEIRMVEGEIENLVVEIKQASSIESIEEKARLQLGMAYPLNSQIIFIDKMDITESELASALKEEAFN